jgi:hypothetical protein
MSQERLEAAVKAWDHHWGDRYGDDAVEEMGEEVQVALAAAEAHDTANGVHRVSLDTTREVLIAHQRQNAGSCLCGWAKLGYAHAEHQAKAIMAAAVKEEQ